MSTSESINDNTLLKVEKLIVEEDEEEEEEGLAQQDSTIGLNGETSTVVKKKKKKRKTNAQKREALERSTAAAVIAALPPPVILKISRNKHLKYISSFHGPWLSLPHEILESLLQVNCDPEALNSSTRYKAISSSSQLNSPISDDGKIPPPIDPSVFHNILKIRKLVDDASELASNGFGSNMGMESTRTGGRKASSMMSPIRQHRLRALAVAKLAEAYGIDEIAASVAIMAGSTSLDDLASRVLRYEPDSLDAKYVNFFHEKIPSRTLAISTDTTLLDQLIASNPHRLQYYRTRGIIYGFKQDYPAAIENYTQALAQAKATRKANQFHDAGLQSSPKNSRKKGKNVAVNGELRESINASFAKEDNIGTIGKEAGDDLERQMLFHRGMAQYHFACKLIEDAILDIEGVAKPQGGLSTEGGELTLRNVGINLKDETTGLYDSASAVKQEKYRTVLSDPTFKDSVTSLLRKALRDQERFLAFFSIWEIPSRSDPEEKPSPRFAEKPLIFKGRRLIHHRSLSGRSFDSDLETSLLTTYHPLLVEAHFSVLLILLLLGDFKAVAIQHDKVVKLMDQLEGYPVFLPARSLNHSQYCELLERLAGTWFLKRESQGFRAPELVEGDLKPFQDLLYFFSPDFVDILAARAEEAATASAAGKKEDRKSKASTEGLSTRLLENGSSSSKESKSNGTKSNWAQEREKVEAERRKIDPSYCLFNTARAEMALAWILSAILPEKELHELKSNDERVSSNNKGKGKGKGKGNADVGSSSNQVNGEGSSSAM